MQKIRTKGKRGIGGQKNYEKTLKALSKKELRKNQKEKKRTPRPLGITLLCKDLNTENEEKKRKELEKKIQRIWINHWASRGFMINDKSYNVQELANKLGCREEIIVQGITAPLHLMGRDLESQSRALLSYCLILGSSDRKHIMAQHEILSRGQNGRYKPFISDAVSRGISLMDANTKTMLAIAKELKPDRPKVQLNTALITNTESPDKLTSETGKWIGPNEAIKLLEANRPQGLHLLESPEAQEALFAESLPESESLPEVIATKQQGISLDGHEGPILRKVKKVHTDRNGPHILSSTIILPPV